MTINFHDHFRPCNDVIFSILFGQQDLFCKLISAVTGDTVEIAGKVHSQAAFREQNVLLSTIQFDTFAVTRNNMFYTADMQRSFWKARLTRRTVFYACRAISTQSIKKMAYEDLQPVNISFILTDRDEQKQIRHIKLMDTESFEVYDDLMELTLVYVPAVLREGDPESDLFVFARFFAVDSKEEADQFSIDHGSTGLGKELVLMYNQAVSDLNNLYAIENSPYFQGRLSEAEIEEAAQKLAQKAAQKAVKTNSLNSARYFLSLGVAAENVATGTGLTLQEVQALRK